MSNSRFFALGILAFGWWFLPCESPLAGAARADGIDSDIFARSKMTEVKLNGLKCLLGQPVTVTSQISWGTRYLNSKGQPEMMFTHFFPSIARFPGGNLIAIYCMEADCDYDPFFLNGSQISRDGGAHWGRRSTVIMQHNSDTFVALADDTLMAIPSEFTQQAPGDLRNFVGPGMRFEHGGDQIVIIPDGVKVIDWPWPLPVSSNQSKPRENWQAGPCITGNALRLGNQILATAEVAVPEDNGAYLAMVLVSSSDEGRTWRYFSTVAGPESSLKGKAGYEGPNESALIQLADGDLMAVFRVGGNIRWKLRRCYSHDGGHTWTPQEALPAYSVMPSMVRTAGGFIAVSSGRPGIGLWISADPRGATWQKIDIVEHHNTWAPDPSYRISSSLWGSAENFRENPLYPRPPNFKPSDKFGGKVTWQTTGYTKLVEVSPDRLLLTYERDAVIREPDRPPSSLQDLSRVFVLPIELERN